MTIHYQGHGVTLHHGDCLDVLRTLPDASVDSVVTDPPYALEFMGKDWDKFGGTIEPSTDTRNRDGNWTTPPFGGGGQRVRFGAAPGLPFQRWCELWTAECLRVLKPGGHLLAFGGTRTWHRLACAVEDAGFEVRDSIAWMHGQGFPKSQNVSKALGDKRCQCEAVESTHDGDVRGVRDGVPATTEPRRPGEVTDLLAPVQREGARPGVGEVRGGSAEDARPLRPEDGRGEPRMEGRRDLQAPEGELCGPTLREVPTGVPADGADGRLHHGAPARDGSTVRQVPAAVGGGESHQPRPTGQPAGEPGALPVERGSQAWGGWPLCGRCGKPSIPDGLGTAAKPAFEPVVVARKPLSGTVAANVLEHGTGALNIDGCRVEGPKPDTTRGASVNASSMAAPLGGQGRILDDGKGRWPANVVLDESQDEALDEQSGERPGFATQNFDGTTAGKAEGWGNIGAIGGERREGFNDTGGASRFFYVAKADATERPRVNGTAHPTVKPLSLMRWLVRLVTPPGGTVLEPFAGSGTTVEACIIEGFDCIAIEKGDEYLPLIMQRIHRRRGPVAAIRQTGDELGLFELDGEGA